MTGRVGREDGGDGDARALYEHAPWLHVTIDHDHRIVDRNRAAARVVGPVLGPDGDSFDRCIDAAGHARFRAFVDEVFATGRARCDDVVVLQGDAPPLDVLIDGVVLPEGRGGPPRAALAIVDITSRKAAEAARRKAQDEVLATVSHDLRGPLSSIALACDGLASDLAPDERQRCVAAIERSAARCERLIERLRG